MLEKNTKKPVSKKKKYVMFSLQQKDYKYIFSVFLTQLLK